VKRLSFVIGALVVCLAVAAPFAQSEKVTLRIAPAPDQTVRLVMAQDMDMDMSVDGTGTLPGLGGPMKMVMRTTAAMTQKVGPRKPDGSVDAEMTYQQVKSEMSMNGQVLPISVPNPLENLTVRVTYNRDGKIVDFKGLPDTGAMSADSIEKLITSFSGNLPTEPIAVGDEVTTPISIALPLPIAGGAPMNMTTSTKTKLVSIDNSAAGRSARLEASLEGKMGSEVPSPDGKGSMKFDFIISGGGTTVMDLASGVLRSSLMTTNMNGTINMGSAAPAGTPPMRMRMTMTVTIARD